MKSKLVRFLAALVTLSVVQLSCDVYEFYDDRSERDRDRDDCEDRGGVWHDAAGWCEITGATNTPAQSSLDDNDCNATQFLSVSTNLRFDEDLPGGHHCGYTLEITNSAEQVLIFYFHTKADNDIHSFTPEWVPHYEIEPGETIELDGDSFAWDNGVWSYYTYDRIAATYNSYGCMDSIEQGGDGMLDGFSIPVEYYCVLEK
ncbi:MAG: hypothetical protein FJZ96_00900 [Chloroflexi bacterium]|nr:hypothetical protein [Chloroflexota bacterium]